MHKGIATIRKNRRRGGNMNIRFYTLLYPGHPEKHRNLLEFANDSEAIRTAKAGGAILIRHTLNSKGLLDSAVLSTPWDK